MTSQPIRWTRVLFGAGLTLAIAIAPLVYIMFSQPAPSESSANASNHLGTMSLSPALNFGGHDDVVLAVACIAIVGFLAAVAVKARSQREIR